MLNSASFPASWGSQGVMYMFARKSRLLGKARPYYLIVPLPYNASARCFDALRLLNMTENFYESAVNRLIRPFFVFYALQPPVIPSWRFYYPRPVIPAFLFSVIPRSFSFTVIPSVAEESRGNETLSLFSAAEEHFCKGLKAFSFIIKQILE